MPDKPGSIAPIMTVLPDGPGEWRVFGALHREDGPAVEWSNGDKEWWTNGKLIVEAPAAAFAVEDEARKENLGRDAVNAVYQGTIQKTPLLHPFKFRKL